MLGWYTRLFDRFFDFLLQGRPSSYVRSSASPDAPAGEPQLRVTIGELGDFYVAAGCCIQCGLPAAESHGLMAMSDEHKTCYFQKQPRTAEEVDVAIGALSVSCVGGPRYGGQNPEIIGRLYELGLNSQCDRSLSSVTKETKP